MLVSSTHLKTSNSNKMTECLQMRKNKYESTVQNVNSQSLKTMVKTIE